MRDYAEIAHNLRCCGVDVPCDDCTYQDDIVKCGSLERQAADAIEELLAAVPRWISVEERLPEAGERVLVSNGGFVCESFMSQSGRWQRGGVDMFFMTPTHWMPLPSAPKEEEHADES